MSRSSYSRFFAHTAFIITIIFQRFGVHVGQAGLSVSMPFLLALPGLMLVTGHARVSAKLLIWYLAFALWAALSACAATLWPDERVGFSMLSLLSVLSLYVTFTVRPTTHFDGEVVQRVFLFYVRLCAVLGILEFALQFAGIKLFSFTNMFPRLTPFLLEDDFGVENSLGDGSALIRSNGFFLLEPSIFSQILAIAIVLDLLIRENWNYLPLYLIAYMTSYSGTGLLSFSVTMAFYVWTSRKAFVRVFLLGVAGVLVVGLFALLLPDQFFLFLGRVTEINSESSSANGRYLAQAAQFREFGGEWRALLGYGPGATVRSRFWVPGSGNPVLMLFVDYGLIGLVLFGIFLVKALWSSRYAVLSVVILVTYQLGGGNLQFAQFILLFSALCIWGTEAPIGASPDPRLQAIAAPVT